MKPITLVALLLVAACQMPLRNAHAESTSRSYYNDNGSFAGSSVPRGNSSSFYDSG